MMTTLSQIEPDVSFFCLEPLICDADDMVDVLTTTIHRHFEKKCPRGGYVLSAEEGARLFFLASMASAMSNKARQAWYRAVENDRSPQDQRSSA